MSRTRLQAACLAFAMLVAVAACGGGSGGASPGQQAPPPPAPPPQPPPPTPPPPGANDLAITNVTIVPMDGSGPQAAMTVLVDGGRIVGIGPSATTEGHADRVVDASGLYLLPGMADMHVHVYEDDELPLFVANGVTTVRNMWGVPGTLAMRSRVAAGHVIGPTIITSGPIIDGSPPYWQDSAIAATPAQGRAHVRAHRQQGYDFIKVYDGLGRPTFDAIADESRQQGLRFAGHAPDAMPLAKVFGTGIWSIEHLDGFFAATFSPANGLDPGNLDANAYYALLRDVRDGVRPWSDLFDPALRESAARLSADSGVGQVPTMVLWQKRYVTRADEATEFARPEMRFVRPGILDEWRTANSPVANLTDEQIELTAFRRQEDFRIVEDLHEAGNEIVAGTDARNRFVVFGFAIHEELALLVQSGLTPYEAMAAATVNAARFAGQEGEFGTIAPGRRADLVLYGADPTADIANSRLQQGVVLRGRYLSRNELEAVLEDIAAGYGQ